MNTSPRTVRSPRRLFGDPVRLQALLAAAVLLLTGCSGLVKGCSGAAKLGKGAKLANGIKPGAGLMPVFSDDMLRLSDEALTALPGGKSTGTLPIAAERIERNLSKELLGQAGELGLEVALEDGVDVDPSEFPTRKTQAASTGKPKPSTFKLGTAKVWVMNTLKKRHLDVMLKGATTRAETCFLANLNKHRSVDKEVRVYLLHDFDGRVMKRDVLAQGPGRGELESCLEGIIDSWRFPAVKDVYGKGGFDWTLSAVAAEDANPK